NRLVSASSPNSSSTFGYDFTGARAKVVSAGATTYYPEMTYNITAATKTKNIFADGALMATITNAPSSTVFAYNADDFLGGSNDETNASGTLTETIQYYPYGCIRIDNTFGSYPGQQRKYIGQQYDSGTALSYLNARYYNGSQGQFLSEDPVFLGNPGNQTHSD